MSRLSTALQALQGSGENQQNRGQQLQGIQDLVQTADAQRSANTNQAFSNAIRGQGQAASITAQSAQAAAAQFGQGIQQAGNNIAAAQRQAAGQAAQLRMAEIKQANDEANRIAQENAVTMSQFEPIIGFLEATPDIEPVIPRSDASQTTLTATEGFNELAEQRDAIKRRVLNMQDQDDQSLEANRSRAYRGQGGMESFRLAQGRVDESAAALASTTMADNNRNVQKQKRMEDGTTNLLLGSVLDNAKSLAKELEKSQGDATPADIIQRLFSGIGTPVAEGFADLPQKLLSNTTASQSEAQAEFFSKVSKGQLDASYARSLERALGILITPGVANSLPAALGGVDAKTSKSITDAARAYFRVIRPGARHSAAAIGIDVSRGNAAVFETAIASGADPTDRNTQSKVIKGLDAAARNAPELITTMLDGDPDAALVATEAIAAMGGLGPNGDQGADLIQSIVAAKQAAKILPGVERGGILHELRRSASDLAGVGAETLLIPEFAGAAGLKKTKKRTSLFPTGAEERLRKQRK